MTGRGGSDGPNHAPLSLVLSAATPLAHVLRSRSLRVSVDEVPNLNPNPNPNLNANPNPKPDLTLPPTRTLPPTPTLPPTSIQAAPPPSFREGMAVAIEAEQR